MDDDDSGGSLPGRFLVLVGPAAVVGHGVSVEQRLILGGEAGVVHQDDDRAASHVDAFIVVPVVFRCDDAVSHEHQGRVRQSRPVDHPFRPAHEFGAESQLGRRTAASNRERRLVGDDGFHQRDVLKIAVAVAGLQAHLLERIGEVLDGEFFAVGGRGPSLELVRRQRLDVLSESCFIDDSEGWGDVGIAAAEGGEACQNDCCT